MTLEQIWKKIIYRRPYGLLDIPAFILWLVSFPHRLGVWISKRKMRRAVKLPLPVISIGNLTVGGSGKTPLVDVIGRHLIRDGLRVGIVLSGYGRKSREMILDQGHAIRRMTVDRVGDEVSFLADRLPDAIFAVADQKLNAATALANSGKVDVIIVDDGYQHFVLARDIDIVAYDAALKKSVLKPFPYGVMREPLKSLERADVIIVTRARFATDIKEISKRLASYNSIAGLYSAQFAPRELVGRERTLPVKYLEDKSVFLFAGIGNFRSLKRQVTALAGDLDGCLELSDHQHYSAEVLARIRAAADEHDSDLLLTTGKDWVKLGDYDFGREIYYLDIAVDLDPGEEKLVQYLKDRLNLKTQRN